MSNKKVLTGAERKAQLLVAGAKLASKHGATNVTRRMVATECKCAEALVNTYLGDTATAQKAYARKAKAMGLTLPSKEKAEEIGKKLRAHGPRDARDTRKRSAKEVKAIKEKRAAREVKPTAPTRAPARKPATKPLTSPGKAPAAPERKSAARKPKAPPALPPLPAATDSPPLPPPLSPIFP